MSDALCCSCRSPKIAQLCQVCSESVCGECTYLLDVEAFSFLAKVPEILTHTLYCRLCFDQHVEPEQKKYTEIVDRAKNVIVLTDAYRGYVPLLKKSKTEVKVENQPDRNETIMRLAFFAAEAGYNALVSTTITRKKIRNHAHQKSEWGGWGVPASIDEDRLRAQELREEKWQR